MNVEAATVNEDRSDARRKYREYRSALKIHKQQYIAALAQVYWQLAHGRKVIDVAKAIVDAGPNEKGEPRLAIARADQPRAHFTLSSGQLEFPLAQERNRNMLKCPVPWPKLPYRWADAPTPLIPPQHLPLSAKGDPRDLANYHILWEVEKWEPLPPEDPLLLRRLDGALFVIVAAWDLTPAEKAVMRQALRV